MSSNATRITQKLWHRKARWFIRRILFKTPTNESQMRELCNAVVERRHSMSSPATAVIVNTAMNLWSDPNLVQALNNNPTYQSARERIHKTANHLISSPDEQEFKKRSSQMTSIMASTREAVASQFQTLQCPTCGIHIQCLHNHHHFDETINNNSFSEKAEISELESLEQLEANVEEYDRFSTGAVGNVPTEKPTKEHETKQEANESTELGWEPWFGPLVLATFAVFGIAVDFWTGKLVAKSITSRVFMAVTVMVQASNNLFQFLQDI